MNFNIVDKAQFNNELMKITTDYEYAKSYNHQNCITVNTNILIVGTITPYTGNGYFYTSQYNIIFEAIDNKKGTSLVKMRKLLIPNTLKEADLDGIDVDLLKIKLGLSANASFADLKNELSKCKGKQIVIETIKEILIENNIAFLDVIDEAIRKKNSADDNDILYCTLDYTSFKNAFKLLDPHAMIICNSKTAEKLYKKIVKEIFSNSYASQSRRVKNAISKFEEIL